MCVHKTEEGLCRKYSVGGDTSYCVEGPCPDEVPSNSDRIRAMSDEQMAKDLINMIMELCEDGEPCYDFALDWFKRPAEED